ncbi:Roadblock/LC7 family protein [Methanocaldococcus sp. FS406-22]|uniref:roadblock/LC7 domain-containing protein n=1 Tax=Methanocaldococcus sp. (strain FS406-22) TaxID=644281 RepID=UPI0001BF3A02|nr:roadblock/LC7 domain-containing protein [Methanocaldococcus sp. FS406-22]ADC69764.1 Roadblock/LC7 family protein [Methanocaldococcus sp. FS406-22]
MIPKEILEEIKDLDYVHGVLLIGNDGLVEYSSLPEDDLNTESLGARLSIILNSISEVIKDIYNENTECIFIKAENHGIQLFSKDGSILAILFKGDDENIYKILPLIKEILK